MAKQRKTDEELLAQNKARFTRAPDTARTHNYSIVRENYSTSVPERNAQRTAEQRVNHTYADQVQRVADIRRSSTPQRNYIEVLLGKLENHNPIVHAQAEYWYRGLDHSQLPFALADKTIKRLLHHLAQSANVIVDAEMPQAERPAFDPYTDVPSGYYAIDGFTNPNDGETHFFRISRWKNSSAVKVQEQASDTLYPVRPWSRAKAVLDEIRKDPRAAAERYANELGQCYACGRTLTDADSRRKGIGPICEEQGRGW